MVKVSVVVPVYNVELYIERCARSLFEQSLEDMEFIFVDDCSPDNSVKIIEQVLAQYPHRRSQTKIIRHVKNKGLTAARNSGLEIANGEYIAHCDSDDWVSSDMYKRLLLNAEKSEADIAYCDFIAVYPDKCIEYDCSKIIDNKADFIRYYMTHGWTSIWNMISKKTLYTDHGLSSPTDFTYCEDFYLSVKLMYFASKVVKLNEYLYYYNRLNMSSLLNKDTQKSMFDELRCYSSIIDFFVLQGCIDEYIRELSWKILRCKQDLVLDRSRHEEFLALYPESNKYIWSCPFLNFKMKVMMLLLSLRLRPIVMIFLWFRKVVKSLQ